MCKLASSPRPTPPDPLTDCSWINKGKSSALEHKAAVPQHLLYMQIQHPAFSPVL